MAAGFVDDPTQLLAQTGVLLAPAPDEPFGLTVVEAMARATPVIAKTVERIGRRSGWMVGYFLPATWLHLLVSSTTLRIETLLLTVTTFGHVNSGCSTSKRTLTNCSISTLDQPGDGLQPLPE